jgi:medium-chain acyl-[acyl-carrier-protein] hydrolase
MTLVQSTPWIGDPACLYERGIRLFCFPAAGTGAAFYAPWRSVLGGDVALCAVRPPGRESRASEAPFTDVRFLVEAAESELRPLLRRPYAVFGHCSGSLLAFEFVQRVRFVGGPLPIALLVSAQAAPNQRQEYRRRSVDELSRPELLDRLREIGIADEEVLASDDLVDLLEPMVRADFALADGYRFAGYPPLPVPITAFGDAVADRDGHRFAVLAAWRSHTTSAFRLRLLPDLRVPRGEPWLDVGLAVSVEVGAYANGGT